MTSLGAGEGSDELEKVQVCGRRRCLERRQTLRLRIVQTQKTNGKAWRRLGIKDV